MAEVTDEIRARIDIVELVGQRVSLKRQGKDWKGLCPFHGEKTPSFTVSPTKQFYHCFGCGAHGTAISFLMEHAGLGFIDAVKELAGRYGMTVPDEALGRALRWMRGTASRLDGGDEARKGRRDRGEASRPGGPAARPGNPDGSLRLPFRRQAESE